MKDFTFDILDCTRAPVITHDSSWIDCIPKKVMDIITPARMVALKAGEELATLPECLCFLTTRSLVASMNSDWSEIFFYVSCTVMEKWFGEDHWQTIGASRELSQWREDMLTGLRRHIYNSRRKILKQRLNEQNKKTAA